MLLGRLTAPTRVPSASNPTHYALHGYKLRFHKKSKDGSGKCNIVETSIHTDVVHGVIYDFLSNELQALDKAEGYGIGYDHRVLSVVLNGVSHQVITYIAKANVIDEASVPYDWYYNLVLAGAEQNSLPLDYIAGIRAVPFTNDPVLTRKNMAEALKVLADYKASKSKQISVAVVPAS